VERGKVASANKVFLRATAAVAPEHSDEVHRPVTAHATSISGRCAVVPGHSDEGQHRRAAPGPLAWMSI